MEYKLFRLNILNLKIADKRAADQSAVYLSLASDV